jgi:hypothetical protein
MIRKRTHEKGQNLAIVAIVMIGLVGILVLVIDGGQAYMHRRDAQTAADAGAYAGAWTYCRGGTWDEVISEVTNYTQVENKADEFTISVDPDTGIITVTTTINFNTFFAAVFGRPQEKVKAVAAAGCGPPSSGQFILPISWYCQPEVGEVPPEGEEWTFDDCLINGQTVTSFGITEDELKCRQRLGTYNELTGECEGEGPVDLETFHATYYPDLFLVMDTDAVKTADQICTSSDPPGNLNCDIDGDGEDDIIGAGGRAWLDLDGGGGGVGSPNGDGLASWIINGYPGIINIHTWIPAETGGMSSAFAYVKDRVGDIALVPIGDYVCPTYPDDGSLDAAACLENSHQPEGYQGQDTFVHGTANQYYHLGGFGAFYISCVDSGGGGSCTGLCPGHLLAHNANPAYIDCQDKTIEGYFISGLSLPGTGGGPGDPLNVGVEDLKLTE